MSESLFASRLEQRTKSFGVSLSPTETSQFEKFYQLLARWNPRINLTALPLEFPPPAEALDRLFIEPSIAAEQIPDAALSVVDIGSGAGSPAIPMKIRRSRLQLTMVESRSRKAAFLREAVRVLELAGVRVVGERIQTIQPTLAGFADVVTVRALRLDSELLSVITRILKRGGYLQLYGKDPIPDGFRILSERPLPGGSSVRVCGMQPR